MEIFKKNFFDRIVTWCEERKLTENFDHQKEISFIIEELLESTGKYTSETAREKSEKISLEIFSEVEENVSPETIVDAFGDIIVFATGTIAKNGYNPKKVMDEIFKEIDSRKGKIIDGKFIKDKNQKTYKADFSKCKF